MGPLLTLLLLCTLLLLSTLLQLSTLLYTLLQLFTLLPLSTTPVLLARALTNLSPSLTRERRGPRARPRHSDPRSPLYPRLIPSVTQLRLVWPSILVREQLLVTVLWEDPDLLQVMELLEDMDLLEVTDLLEDTDLLEVTD